jgi:hypothetical protein
MMWFTTAHSAAMLVPVVAFGYTPRQPSFTEVPDAADRARGPTPRARRVARGAESLACSALFPSPWRR